MQRLSGVATLSAKFVAKVHDLPVKILDTRKTTPGWRYLDKYAVRCGGGHNHRMNLSDGILIKDNHLAALGGGPVAIRKSILLSRQYFPGTWDIEIEVDNLEMFECALQSSPTIILLDNMNNEDMKAAVQRKNAVAPDVLLEASGGITIANVREVALTGVDRISIGAITHSAPALDLALDYNFS
jgi:nicotinate-nucleotide pyrophosphorylase (carboxylating)